jgi:hypothetical protein
VAEDTELNKGGCEGQPPDDVYCEADDPLFLARVFDGLPHLPCTSSQSEADIQDLIRGLYLFYSEVERMVLRDASVSSRNGSSEVRTAARGISCMY